LRCPLHRAYDRTIVMPGLNPANKTFRRLRYSFLVRHPICTTCKRTASTVLDHIVPHCSDRALFWDQSNFQALCASSDAAETRADQG
jgi:5-methylcytosine-specific restriction protein A